MPQAIISFLGSSNYEDTIRKSISLGGDSDTIGCITGGIAQAHYQTMGDNIVKEVRALLDVRVFKILDVLLMNIVNPSFLKQYK